MGRSQTKRLREATKRFGMEDPYRFAIASVELSMLARARKAEAGLIPPAMTAASPEYSGQVVVKRYSTYLSYQQNEITYGKSWK